MTRAVAFVGLGSNLGDRAATLAHALDALRGTAGIASLGSSRVYETEPVGPPQDRYLNAVARLETTLPPRALLARLLEVERAAGRVRSGERNAPRTLDLDLLLYGELHLEEPELVVPHPRLHQRAFVLEPLCELAADVVHPVLGETIAVLAGRVRDPSAVRLYEP